MAHLTHEMRRKKMQQALDKKNAQRRRQYTKLLSAGIAKSKAQRIVGSMSLKLNGRPPRLTTKVKKQLRGAINDLNKKFPKTQVTKRMVFNHYKSPKKPGFRTLERYFKTDVATMRPREGATLDESHAAKRRTFQNKHKNSTALWWSRTLCVDNHNTKKITTPRCLQYFGTKNRRHIYGPRGEDGRKPERGANMEQGKRCMLFNYGHTRDVILGTCEQAHFIYEVDKENWDEYHACDFLEYVREVQPDRKYLQRIYMDNDPCWSTPMVGAKLKKLGLQRVYQPPNSPDLQPWDMSLNRALGLILFKMFEKSPRARMPHTEWWGIVEKKFFGKPFRKLCRDALASMPEQIRRMRADRTT